MKKIIFSILFIVSLFVAINKATADPFSELPTMEERTSMEKEAVNAWILEKHKNKFSATEARKLTEIIYANSIINGLNPFIVLALIQNESEFKKTAKSFAGAVGMMQVMPRWHKDKLKGRDPFNISTNIEVGVTIFRDCLISSKNNTNKALKCYSGGAKYNERIKTTHNEIKKFVVAYKFDKQFPIFAEYRFDKPLVNI